MSPVRPDLIECWVFRVPPGGEPEFLLIRRAPDRIFPGLWQCVTGGPEPGERIPLAALREVREEVGFGPAEIAAFYDLDAATQFYDEGSDAVVAAATFAVRIHLDVEPRLSREHDGARWVDRAAALGMIVWPTYRGMIERIVETLRDPALEPWFRLDLEGRRLAR
ncbi:MAG: NUDIX domain-containing protein [Chloroflexi bacterium]|nr:NUDIX domain-containing protein [Chloroflexota bacterium]